MSKTIEKYYLLPYEQEPYCICKSKIFITKIIFMVGVSYPQLDATGNIIFNGKIGI